MLICEDDIEMRRNVEKKLEQGMKEIGSRKWDLLYLGCGGRCGKKGISSHWSTKNKYDSSLMNFMDEEIYVAHKNDIRTICDDCDAISKMISVPTGHGGPGGTWSYAYSLAGAKKMLKLLDNDAGNHIDILLKEQVKKGKMTAFAFDPPIIMHEEGAFRSDSDIPWDW